MTSLSNSVAVGDEELFHDNLINKISKSETMDEVLTWARSEVQRFIPYMLTTENGDEDLQFIVSTLWNDQQANHVEG